MKGRVSGRVSGELPGSGDAGWSSLSRRERELMDRSFERELPMQYRELLKAYYEALSE
jgi:hypothetical protein